MVDNKILQITENDVHRVLGLPIGPKSLYHSLRVIHWQGNGESNTVITKILSESL